MLKLAVSLIAFIAQSSAPLPMQFDLLCEGQWQSRLKQPEPYKFRYVVDIEQKKWCKNAADMVKCPVVRQMVRVDETRYTFVESAPGKLFEIDYVDRQTGKSISISRKYQWAQKGDCTVAPFSGFPTPKM